MEYERIGKVQSGIISPSKLRMKLIGPHHLRKKDGSNSNSTRTSPSRHEDAEFVKNSLLASESDYLDDEVTFPSLEVESLKPSSDAVLHQGKSDQNSCEPNKALPKENGNMSLVKMQQHSQKANSGNSSAIDPARTTDDENLDYDSNTSSSSFEFHRGDRPMSNPATRFLLRPIPSKWNDAEKWIMNRQNIQASYLKNSALHSRVNHFPATSMMKVAPESGCCDHKLPKARLTESETVDFCHPTSHMGIEKFSFIPAEPHPVSSLAHGRIPVWESFPQTKELKEVNELDLSCSRSTDDKTAIPGIRSVAMRDMGTEMTPVTSQGPSLTSTPVGSSTPLRSPTPSMPSTPSRGAPGATPLDNITAEDSQFPVENAKKKLSEEELKLKTRREIEALGVKLGKINIASWASKDEKDKRRSNSRDFNAEERERIEFEKRAASWEEAEKSRYTARYKREDIKIQAWESQQKAQLEAEMKKIEAKVEQMRARAHAKAVKKIAMMRQRAEEKLAAAEATRNREAGRTASEAEYIRQTGRMPSSSNYICSCWL